MQSEKPCCPAAAARMIKKLVLPGGLQVGIANLENILKEVADLKLVDDETIKTELLKRVKVYNYGHPVPKLITPKPCFVSTKNYWGNVCEPIYYRATRRQQSDQSDQEQEKQECT